MIRFLIKALWSFKEKGYNRNLSVLNLSVDFEKYIILDIVRKFQFNMGSSFKKEELVKRSFAQYKCQTYLWKRGFQFIINFLSLIVFIPLIFIFLLNFYVMRLNLILKSNKNEKQNNVGGNVGVFMFDDESILPPSISVSYSLFKYRRNWMLSLKDISLITYLIKNYFYEPYFVTHNIINMALYKANLIIYNAENIFSASEYSFSSSFLTFYCDLNGCEHVNLMHGEKLFYIRDAFCSYHKIFLWEDYYKTLFQKLRCITKEFIIEKPLWLMHATKECIKTDKDELSDGKPIFVYYQGGESIKNLSELVKFLGKLRKKFKIVIRLHPRYATKNIMKMFQNFETEDPHLIPVEYSICKAQYVAGLYTTVLHQALWLNKSVVLNNLAADKYMKLRELGYYLLNISSNKIINLTELVS